MRERTSADPAQRHLPHPPGQHVMLPLADAVAMAAAASLLARHLANGRYAEPVALLERGLAGALPEGLSRTTAARALGVSRQTVQRWIDHGEIPASGEGRRTRVPTARVVELGRRMLWLRQLGRQGRLLEAATGRTRWRWVYEWHVGERAGRAEARPAARR